MSLDRIQDTGAVVQPNVTPQPTPARGGAPAAQPSSGSWLQLREAADVAERGREALARIGVQNTRLAREEEDTSIGRERYAEAHVIEDDTKLPPRSDYALVAALPGAVGASPFDAAKYEAAKKKGKEGLDEVFDAVGQLSDDGIRELARHLGRDADLSTRTDLLAPEHLPAYVRALELKLGAQGARGLESMKVSDVQAVADRIFKECGNVADDNDRSALIRLCAATGTPLDSVQFGGEKLSAQWLANRLWVKLDPAKPAENERRMAKRDEGAQYLAYVARRTGVPLEEVFYAEPRPDGYALLNSQGRVRFGGERPVIWKNGAPDWPHGVPFTSEHGAPLVSHAMLARDGSPLVTRTGQPMQAADGTKYLLRQGVPIEGDWLSNYRVTTPPAWVAPLQRSEAFPVLAGLPGPLGNERLQKNFAEVGELPDYDEHGTPTIDLDEDELDDFRESLRAEKIEAYFGEPPFQKMAQLNDGDLALAYLFFQRQGYSPKDMSFDDNLARVRVFARVHELARQPGLEAAVLAETQDAALAKNVGTELELPQPSFPELVRGWRDDPRTKLTDADYAKLGAAMKRLANSTETEYSKVPWYFDGGHLGVLTLENAFTREPMYPEGLLPHPKLYHNSLGQIEEDFGPVVANKIAPLTDGLTTRIVEWSRGPRRIGSKMHLQRLEQKIGRDANIMFSGTSGGGKTSIGNMTMDLLVGSGAAPNGKATIHFDSLEGALASKNKNGVTVSVTFEDVKDGKFVERTEDVEYSKLIGRLKGRVTRFSESQYGTMKRPTAEGDAIGKAFCKFGMRISDECGPVILDTYEVTRYAKLDEGWFSRFREVTVPTPGKSELERGIKNMAIEQGLKRGLNVDLTPEAIEWVTHTLARDLQNRNYRVLGSLLEEALKREAANLPLTVNAAEARPGITLGKVQLIGNPIQAEALEQLHADLRQQDPPLYGLDPQIDRTKEILQVLADLKMSGEDPKARITFETPPGTGLDKVAYLTAETLTQMGLGYGKPVVLDGSVRSEYRAQAENEATGYFETKGLVVVVDTRFFPVQFEKTKAGEKEDPLDLIRQDLGNRLNGNALQCHLVVLGSRSDIEDFTHDWSKTAREKVLQARVTTSKVTDRNKAEYTTDYGHLQPQDLIKYFQYYCERVGVHFEDGAIRSAEGLLTKFFNEQAKLPGFANEVTVESLVESTRFRWAGTADRELPRGAQSTSRELVIPGSEQPSDQLAVVRAKELKEMLGEASVVRGTGLVERARITWRGLTARAGAPIGRAVVGMTNNQVQAMRKRELREIDELCQVLTRLRLGNKDGAWDSQQARNEVLKRRWAVNMLLQARVQDLDRLDASGIYERFYEFGKQLKEELETVSRFGEDRLEVEQKRHDQQMKIEKGKRNAERATAAGAWIRGSGKQQGHK